MTEIYYVRRKASDLKEGDMFVSWFSNSDNDRPRSKRIMRTTQRGGKVTIYLDDAKLSVHKEHVVLVQEVA